jgi:quercetin dioxygenase-like cupin family protein
MARLVFALALLGTTGCAAAPYVTLSDARGAQRTSVARLLATHPLPAEQNISVLALGHTESMSYHLVQVRDRERPHKHAVHDVAVTLLRGQGQLHVGGVAYDMHAGDVAAITRGMPHYFVNGGSAPAAAFAIFTPPYDGQDQVPVE